MRANGLPSIAAAKRAVFTGSWTSPSRGSPGAREGERELQPGTQPRAQQEQGQHDARHRPQEEGLRCPQQVFPLQRREDQRIGEEGCGVERAGPPLAQAATQQGEDAERRHQQHGDGEAHLQAQVATEQLRVRQRNQARHQDAVVYMGE
jgi:hypothetical protein